MNMYILLGLFIIGIISFLFSIIIMFFFGGLIWLQLRVWILASKGYHQVEHVGMDKVRRYFYLKPKDNHFDFKSGFYIHFPETTTKNADGILRKLDKNDKDFLKNVKKGLDDADNTEYEELKDTIEKLVYVHDAITLKWGIPIITYVGKDPFPVNFLERDKVYGAQLIRDVYLRLLATLHYAWMRKVITIMLISLCAIALLFAGQYIIFKKNADSLHTCNGLLNSTFQKYDYCMNNSMMIARQGSNINI